MGIFGRIQDQGRKDSFMSATVSYSRFCYQRVKEKQKPSRHQIYLWNKKYVEPRKLKILLWNTELFQIIFFFNSGKVNFAWPSREKNKRKIKIEWRKIQRSDVIDSRKKSFTSSPKTIEIALSIKYKGIKKMDRKIIIKILIPKREGNTFISHWRLPWIF